MEEVTSVREKKFKREESENVKSVRKKDVRNVRQESKIRQ